MSKHKGRGWKERKTEKRRATRKCLSGEEDVIWLHERRDGLFVKTKKRLEREDGE